MVLLLEMIFLLLLCIVANSKSLCPNQSQLRCSLSKGLQVTQLCASTPPRPTVSGAPEGLRSLVRSYNSALSKHAHPTKMITSAVVAGLGDLLIQLLNHKLHGARKVAVDLRRLFVFMAVAGFYMAPATHWWFNFLDRMPVLRGKSRWAQSLIMIAVDQTAGALLITSGFFFAFELVNRLAPPFSTPLRFSSLLEAGWKANVRNLWPSLVANWYCWPAINLVNFQYVPVQYRVLFANVAAVFWNMFLSNVANK